MPALSRSAVPSWQPVDDLDDRIGGPSTLSMPEDWALSTAWERAQTATDQGGPITDAERLVALSDGEDRHRVTFALKGNTLLAECDCAGYQYHDGWCAHVASLWWRWSIGEIVVSHLDTGREYEQPPAWLELDGRTDYDALTAAELDAYLACERADVGVRAFARSTRRSPGTVGNLLRRARGKLEGER
ncbi:SWIM zinc finger family protein [Halapricum hydrolyticum]|uniref:SWIM zinc finger family protein n=1 Tax=Halapricum hydrolyticum TaxID=2979991 RepID=UPI0028F6CD8B|nr:SWIM zinc finger family protein [Halapricum hydrolyticum]